MPVAVSVSFIPANVNKCQCIKCPVQIKSMCAIEKISEQQNNLTKQPLLKEDVAGVYCASGETTCTDIKPTADCICGKCVVFTEYKLYNRQPMGHYCINGKAQ